MARRPVSELSAEQIHFLANHFLDKNRAVHTLCVGQPGI